mgnify:CR=1 FL=1
MIYLALTSASTGDVLAIAGVDDVHRLCTGAGAVDADLSRSRLYHRLKDLRGRDEPLLVAVLEEVPKFKAMEPGALAWLREHLPPR